MIATDVETFDKLYGTLRRVEGRRALILQRVPDAIGPQVSPCLDRRPEPVRKLLANCPFQCRVVLRRITEN